MRILIVKLSSIGDLFHALPTVHNLKVAFDAEVDWVVNDAYAPLVACFSDVARVIPFQRHRFFRSMPAFRRELRQEQYDLVVDLQGLLKSAVVARMARSKRRIGPSYEREGARFFYQELAGKPDLTRHAVDQALDVIDHLGLAREPIAFPTTFPTRSIKGPGPRIAISPVSRWATKNWSVDRYAELAQRLAASGMAGTLYVLGGPEDAAVCQRVADAAGGCAVNLAGRTSLIETGSVLEQVDLLIANDSGPVHMAVAVDCPTVVIFGPTDDTRTGPYGESNTVVKRALACQPCYKRSCPRGDHACMTSITVENVMHAARCRLAEGI